MSQKQSFFTKYATEIVLFFLFLYAFLPFLSPILLSNDIESSVGRGIQRVYSFFCHQRVDRSLFLFGGEDSQYFYTFEELKDVGYISERLDFAPGYPFWGNEDLGFKVAYCIRDVAIYSSFVFWGFVLVMFMNAKGKLIKFSWAVIIILALPMALDGTFQTLASAFDISWAPDYYMESNLKRLITGILFGMALAMAIFPHLKEACGLGYNEDQ